MPSSKSDYSNITLSVFFPAYNEEANIRQTVVKAESIIKELKLKDYEIIVVDDGSTDQTPQILKDLQKEIKKLEVITHNPNKGYSQALISGLYRSNMDWITFNDSDGQFDFSEITKFLDKVDEADAIIGYRLNRQDSLIRRMNGWGWTFISNLLLGINVRDIDCAFKLIKRDVIQSIPKLESTRGAMISPEMIAKIRKMNYRVIEIGVHHFPRTAGEQTGANIKVILTSFKELFKLGWKIRTS